MTNTHTHTLLTPTQQWNISFRQQSAAGVGLCEGVRGATRIPGCHPTGSDSDEEFRFPTFTPKLFFLILLPPWVVFLLYYYYFANWRVRTLSADSCWYTKLFIYKEIRKKNWQLAFWTASIHPAGWLIHRPINRDCFLFLWWSIFDCLTWFFSPSFAPTPCGLFWHEYLVSFWNRPIRCTIVPSLIISGRSSSTPSLWVLSFLLSFLAIDRGSLLHKDISAPSFS